MATAKKLPSGNWRVLASVSIDGEIVRKSFTSPDRKEAEYEALVWQQTCTASNSKETMTLGNAIDKYIALNSAVLSPSTLTGYRRIRRNYFQNLMNTRLFQITDTMLQKEINKMAIQNLSPKTIRNAYSLILSAGKKYRPGFHPNIMLPEKENIIYNTPDMNDLARIFSAVKDSVIELPIHMAILMGMRMSEIRAAKWSDIKDGTLIVSAAIVDTDSGATEKKTKTSAGKREIIIPKMVCELLEKADRKNEYITTLSANAITKRLYRLMEKNDIPHYCFHSLRHANASIMLLLNVPDKYAMERGGWATSSTLKKVYQQTFKDEQKRIAQHMDIFFEQHFDPSPKPTK